MKMLTRKIRRDIWRQKAQFFAVMLLILLGVSFFGASYDSYQNLKMSYHETHERYGFAHIWLRGSNFSSNTLEKVLALDYVQIAERRLVVDKAVQTKEGLKVTARFIGLPPADGQQINKLEIISGSVLGETGNQVLVEKHFAEYHGYEVGDKIVMLGDSEWQEFVIQGIVISPEYIWPAKNRQEMMTSPANFGVFYFFDEKLDEFTDLAGVRNEIVLITDRQTETEFEDVQTKLAEELQGEGFISSYNKEQQAGNAALQQDLEGFSEMAIFFPILFFSVAAISISVMMSRLVHQQRPQIGVLRASGFSKGPILHHYLSYGLIVAGCGALPGVVVGLLLARTVTLLYTRMLSIPIVSYGFYPITIVGGIGMALFACLLSSWAPARMAIKLQPAQAMRGETPTGQGKISLIERIFPPARKLSAASKIPIRAIERNIRRTIYTILGIILSIVLLLVSWGLIDTVNHVMDKMFNRIYTLDITVTYSSFVDSDKLDELGQIPGVNRVEAGLAMPVTLQKDEQNYETVLTAFEAQTEMHTFLDENDSTMPLPDKGVYLGIGLKDKLGLEIGDKVDLILDMDMMRKIISEMQTSLGESLNREHLAQIETMLQFFISRPFRVEVKGFVNETIGSMVYMNLDEIRQDMELIGQNDKISMAFLKVEPDKRLEVKKVLNDLSDISMIEDAESIHDTVSDMMQLFYLLIGVMLGFGAMMAFGLIFNTMTVNIMERTREIATLRTLGLSRKRITWLITTENILLVFIALVPGMVCGYIAAVVAMAQMNTDIFNFEVVIYPLTYIIVAFLILIVAMLSQFPSLRWVHRMDLTRIIKERTS